MLNAFAVGLKRCRKVESCSITTQQHFSSVVLRMGYSKQLSMQRQVFNLVPGVSHLPALPQWVRRRESLGTRLTS